MTHTLANKSIVGCAALVLGCSVTTGPDGDGHVTSTTQALLGHNHSSFFAPPPPRGAVGQVFGLLRDHEWRSALAVAAMANTPRAIWFNSGTPNEVKRSVKRTTKHAARSGKIPVLVSYNLPFRDCAQYSAGGALGTDEYKAWIDGFAKGIGKREAIVILEPDSLGIIPYNHPLYDSETYEWCQPTIEEDGETVPAPGASPEDRYEQLRYAIATLADHAPKAKVYLDGGHSAWLGIGEAAYRLYRAGFVDGEQRMDGFFLNVSNYRATNESITFGTWVSMCLAAGTPGVGPDWMWNEDLGRPNFDWCGSQYDPETGYTEVNYSPEFAEGVTAGIQGLMDGAAATVPFVIDTSRNGQGHFDAAPYGEEPYNQPEAVVSSLNSGSWCNPPGRGLGLRPDWGEGVALLDAYLWVKVPGESDGQCDITGGARAWDFDAYDAWDLAPDDQLSFDPLWGRVDPDAGDWFPEQALELTELAEPGLF